MPGLAALNKGEVFFNKLSCGSPGNCAGGGEYTDSAGNEPAFVASEVNGTWQKARPVPGLAALSHGGQGSYLDAVSCARRDYCVLGGAYWTPKAKLQAFLISEVNGTWGRAEQVPGLAALNLGGEAALTAVSCPSVGNCTAGGGYTDAAGYGQAFIVSEHGGTWQVARQVSGTASAPFTTRDPAIGLISCPSPGNCSASGDVDTPETAFVVSETNGRWHGAELVPGLDALNTGSDAEITGLSCPSAGNCGAGGYYLDRTAPNPNSYRAFTVSEVNGTWREAKTVRGFPAVHGNDEGIDSLSCGSPGNCGAAGTYGYTTTADHVVTTNKVFVVNDRDGTWGKAQQVRGIPVVPGGKQGFATLAEISCTAPGDCSAGGGYNSRDGHSHPFVLDETDGSWGAAEQVPGISAVDNREGASVGALACSSPAHCTAVGVIYPEGSKVRQVEQIFAVSER